MSQPRFENAFLFALSVWVLVSIAASAVVRSYPLLGLGVGVLGGAFVGYLSARRVGPRRVKVRRRHREVGTPGEETPGA